MSKDLDRWVDLFKRAKSLAEDAKTEFSELTDSARDTFPDVWKSAKENGLDTWKDWQRKGERWLRNGRRSRSSQGALLGTGLLIGAVVGYLIWKKNSEEPAEHPEFN